MPMQTWEINRTIYKVSDFLSWQRASSLVLTPKFQRRSVWKAGAKSLLIDTVARGLPMPIIFIREQSTDVNTLEPKREIVDGQQRIRTLISYIQPSLLRDYNPTRDDFVVRKTHNPDLAGRRFPELHPDIRQRILDYQFSVHILPAYVDDREVIQLFARMNSTGLQLTAQELRNAEWFGEFKTSMYESAAEQLQRWRDWGIFTEQEIARMEEVELVSEFALLALKGVMGKSKKAIDTIYREKDDEFPERAEVERRFRYVMDTIDANLGQEMSSLAYTRKTLFFTLYAYIYDLSYSIGSRLSRVKPAELPRETFPWAREAAHRIDQADAPRQVLESSSRRTTHPSSRLRILRYLRDRK